MSFTKLRKNREHNYLKEGRKSFDNTQHLFMAEKTYQI